MRRGRLIAITVALAALQGACAHHAATGKDRSAQIGLGRRGSWASYAVTLPMISGSTVQLRLVDRTLIGFVENSSLRVRIDADRASGFGPSGSVDVAIGWQGGGTGGVSDASQLTVDGLWNGGPVHLIVGPTGLRASVTRWGKNLSQQAMCSYNLDHRDPDGALTGASICEGLPQRTRLEIDERIRQMLTPAEFAVLLVTVLASPPGAGRF